jgi:hypothetical protein
MLPQPRKPPTTSLHVQFTSTKHVYQTILILRVFFLPSLTQTNMDNALTTRVRGLDSSLAIATSISDNDTPTTDLQDRVTITDWSKTGRGSHVDFEKQEKVPLEQGINNSAGLQTHQLTIQVVSLVEVRRAMYTKSKLKA